MAQQVKLMGAIYSDVPSVRLPDANDTLHSFTDCSVVTAVASDVAQGKVFVANDGTVTTGTASGGGGSSSWTKVAETSYVIPNYTSTSSAEVDTWSTGHSEIWTAEKIVYIRIRDTAGRRNNYFYGSDNFYITPSSTVTQNGFGIREIYRGSSTAYGMTPTNGTTGYGVYTDYIYPDGRIHILKRYNSTNSKAINGTYKVEVYLLDMPTGAPIFG